MASVLDDPTSRLYAGALLGKALSKELGTVGALGTQQNVGARRATVTAGIASGHLKPDQLSAGDAGLLGQAITKQHISSSPFGFVGGFLGNLAKGGGEFLESLKGIPQAIGSEVLNVVGPGQAITGHKKKFPIAEALPKIPGQVVHDFSSPRQFYEHPFNPLLDVASVFSLGAGAVAKGSLIARLKQIDRLNLKPGEVAPPPSGIIRKGLEWGSPQGRAPGRLSPHFTGDELAQPTTFDRYYATQRPFMKYAVQKPLDYTISRLQKLPGGIGQKLKDLEASYNVHRLVGRTRGQEVAGTSESMLHGPIEGYRQAVVRMYRRSDELPGLNKTAAGQFKHEAMIRHAQGINNLEKLDEYAKMLNNGEDVEGVVMGPPNSPARKMADYRANTLYQDPRFRQLIEKPTDDMKEAAYQLRRLSVYQAHNLDISPRVVEDAAFGRLREMTGKTTEELIGELPKSMRPQSEFARKLYVLQQAIKGEETAEVVPTIKELAHHLPYGSIAQREDLLSRAYASLVQDIHGVGTAHGRLQQLGYLPGNNLFEKIATGLHDEMGVPLEQAQAFARGIALGDAGKILPTYVPSVTGERLHFGIRPENLKTRLGRHIGVAKFKEFGEGAPTLYDVKRPFNPRTVSAQTIGRGPGMKYLEQATYAPFQKGIEDLNPEAIIRNSYHINRDIISRKLTPQMLEKVSVKNPHTEDGIWLGSREVLETLGPTANYYDYIPLDTYRNYFTTQHELEMQIADVIREGRAVDLEGEIEALAEENAQKFVSEEMHHAAMGKFRGVVVPKTFTNEIIKHARAGEELGFWGKLASSPVALWKTAVLSFSPAWLFRTIIGHGMLALIDGTTSLHMIQQVKQAHSYFAETDRPVLPEHVQALDKWKKTGDEQILGGRYQPEGLPFGVNQGGLRQELADIKGLAPGLGEMYVPRKISQGVHVGNNFQRRAIYLRKLDVGAKQRMAELGLAFDHPGGFWNSKNIDAVMDPEFRATVLKYPDLVEHAFDQLAKVSYTFSQMRPWERQLVRYGMPFYGWYKFVSKFVASMPLNYPARAFALAQLGKVGIEEHENLGPMPDWLSGALFMPTQDLSHASYINLYGLNPMSDVANPFGPEGIVGGTVHLGQTSPVIQTVLAGFGIDPLTGKEMDIDPSTGIEKDRFGNYFDTKTGKPISVVAHAPLSRVLGTFLRTFPEIRNAELAATGGRPVYPESVPFVSEHPRPVETKRGNTILSAITQELGVQPRVYNLQKYGANQLKSVIEARHKAIKTQARQRARLSEP